MMTRTILTIQKPKILSLKNKKDVEIERQIVNNTVHSRSQLHFKLNMNIICNFRFIMKKAELFRIEAKKNEFFVNFSKV